MKGIACEIMRVETERDFVSAIERGGFDLLLADIVMKSRIV